jgi:hypothetical protein
MVDEMIAKRLLEAFRRAGGLFFFFLDEGNSELVSSFHP